jgi:histone deacetylase 1/2
MDDPTADDDLLIPPDTRRPARLLDSRRQADGELSDSDDEGTGGRRNHASGKDSDNISENGSGHKLVGAGIMNFGAHSGPSSHTTVARVLSSSANQVESNEKNEEGDWKEDGPENKMAIDESMD